MMGLKLSPAEIAEINARACLPDLARGFGARLRGNGRNLKGSCPICGGSPRSNRFEIKGDAWVCAVCQDGGDAIALVRRARGCDFNAAIEFLGGARRLTAAEQAEIEARRAREEKKREEERQQWRAREISYARYLWSNARWPAQNGPVRRYLAGRGVALPGTALIREMRALDYWHSTGGKPACSLHKAPAMLAAILDNARQVTGLHITWLKADGAGKAEIFDPETGEALPAKKMRGHKQGGHLQLRQPPSFYQARLFIAEGIETALSVATALKATGGLKADDIFWAAADLGNLGGKACGTLPHPTLKSARGAPLMVPSATPDFTSPAIRIPAAVSQLILLGDGDSDPVLTTTTLERGRQRYARPGLRIAIAMAPTGMDFNDMLRGQG